MPEFPRNIAPWLAESGTVMLESCLGYHHQLQPQFVKNFTSHKNMICFLMNRQEYAPYFNLAVSIQVE